MANAQAAPAFRHGFHCRSVARRRGVPKWELEIVSGALEHDWMIFPL